MLQANSRGPSTVLQVGLILRTLFDFLLIVLGLLVDSCSAGPSLPKGSRDLVSDGQAGITGSNLLHLGAESRTVGRRTR